ncbi:MAG TPA: zinc ABC transporter substrate-binding protein [Armatimonadetes bacterium]|nr:zinc ABC transporter substrate-binding protein [Armatimonadota bacterium]
MRRNVVVFFLMLVGLLAQAATAQKLRVVTSLPDYAAIVEEVGGERVGVNYIVQGNQDAHFVKPKPSYSLMLRAADLFVTTGLDLELWAPTLIDRSGNRHIREGQPGYVRAAANIPLLEKPVGRPSRAAGDIHIYGNPHIHTSPLNGKIIARNILAGLKRIDPAHAAYYERREKDFEARLDRALFGERLVKILGGDLLSRLLRQHKLFPFLKGRQYRGKPLINYLGGWLKAALPLRGQKIIGYHKNWIYFADTFGLKIVEYIEPKPGIPPTPAHVERVIRTIRQQNVKVMLIANYFERSKPRLIEQRTGIKAVFVPLSVRGEPGVNTYFDLFDLWIRRLTAAFQREVALKEQAHARNVGTDVDAVFGLSGAHWHPCLLWHPRPQAGSYFRGPGPGPDSGSGGYSGLSVRLALRIAGCLRVFPGLHHPGRGHLCPHSHAGAENFSRSHYRHRVCHSHGCGDSHCRPCPPWSRAR